jgi:hypothetical protein
MLGQLKHLSKPGAVSNSKHFKQKRSTKNVALVIATTLCLSLVTSACSSSKSNSTTSTTPVASNPSSSPQTKPNSGAAAPNVVRIGFVRWGLLPLIKQLDFRLVPGAKLLDHLRSPLTIIILMNDDY